MTNAILCYAPYIFAGFGQPAAAPAGGGLFGASTAAATPAFGAASTQPSPFGAKPATTGFGAPAATPAFGAAQPAASPFGAAAQTAKPAFGAAPTGGLFGGAGVGRVLQMCSVHVLAYY